MLLTENAIGGIKYTVLGDTKTAGHVDRLFLVGGRLSATSAELLDLSELHELFVVFALLNLLEFRGTLHVLALGAGEVSSATHLWNDASSLHTLGETTNDVRAALRVVLFYLDIGCHSGQEDTIRE